MTSMTKPKIAIHHFPATDGSPHPPLLFVHGAWHGAWCWQDGFIDRLNQQGFDCYAIDLRGHGESEAAKTMRWNRIADYVDDVSHAVEIIGGKPILVGHSMGGFICQHMSHRNAPLSGIALMASAPHNGVWRLVLRMLVKDPLALILSFAKLSLLPVIRSTEAIRDMFLDANTPDPKVKAFGAKLIDESFLAFLDMLLLDLPKRPAARPPMLVIGGEKDTVCLPSEQQSLADYYGVDCHIIEDAPHNLMSQTKWQEAADKLAEWVEIRA